MLSFFKKKDKQLHILGSATLTVTIYLATKSLVYATVGTLLVGIGKEVYDYYHPKKHTADIKDVVADVIGVAVVVSFILIAQGVKI